MNWKIESHPIDVAEIGPNDHQNIYLVNILDEGGRPIEARQAYGREFIAKYSEYITKIEHSEDLKK